MKITFGAKEKTNLIILFVALLSIRFLNKNSTLCLLIAGLTIIFIFGKKTVVKPTVQMFLLFLYEALYYVIYSRYYGFTDASAAIAGCIGAPLLFVSGYYLVSIMSGTSDLDGLYRKVFFAIALGGLFFIALSYFTGGTVIQISYGIDNRYYIDFWTKELYYCTNFNAYGAFMCIGFYPVLISNTKLLNKIIYGAGVLLTALISLATGSRTNLYLIIAMLALGVTIHISTGRFGKYLMNKNRLLFILIMLQLVGVAWLLFGSTNDMTSIFSVLNQRGMKGLFSDSRWVIWKDSIEGIIANPWGNVTGLSYDHSHNMFLDVARYVGVIPMVALMLFYISSFRSIKKCYHKDYLSFSTKLLIVLLWCGLFLSFMIEPVLQAKPYIFMLFCFLCGINCRNEKIQKDPFISNQYKQHSEEKQCII